MQDAVYFPHLGIRLSHVGKSVSVLGFPITYYGILIGLAMVIGILIAAAEAKRTKQNTEDYFDLAVFAIVFAIIGARIYYVIFDWSTYKSDILSVFNIRQGGLAIYGGVIAAVITVFVFAAKKNLSAWKILDTAVLGLTAGQIIGRWGNFFNREAFGEYTNGLFAMQIPVDAVRVSDITDKMRAHLIRIDGTSFIQVHPTFLYESIWCLLLLIFLLWMRKKKEFDGEVFLMYMFGYGVGRLWIEGLRTDQLLIPGTKLAVSQILALLFAAFSAVLIVCNHKRVIRKKQSIRYRRAVKECIARGIEPDEENVRKMAEALYKHSQGTQQKQPGNKNVSKSSRQPGVSSSAGRRSTDNPASQRRTFQNMPKGTGRSSSAGTWQPSGRSSASGTGRSTQYGNRDMTDRNKRK